MIKRINKGFTLIELIITIALISLTFILVYISVNTIINTSSNKKEELNKELILKAGEEYAMEYKNRNNFSKYTSSEGITNFCISINTLLKYGIYNNEEIIKEYIDKYAIYVEGKNEVYSYKLIELNDINNKCIGTKYISQLKDDNSSNIINVHEKGNNNDDITILDMEYDFNIIENKKYVLELNLKKYANIEHKELTLPVYVVLVLDKSGSMNNTKYSSAKQASIKLSEKLLDNFGINANIALIQFSDNAVLKRNFQSNILLDNNFDSPSGLTNVANSLNLANNLFLNLNKTLNNEYDNTLKYTILLYDGSPTDSFDDIKNASDVLKNTYNSKLITIGYEFYGNNKLKEISSLDNNLCTNSNYLNYCYYESTSSNIDSLFDEIQNNISLEVFKTKASKAKIDIKLNDNLKVDINNELLDTITYKVDLNEKEEINNYSYNIVLDENIFNDCKKGENCSKEINLFDSIVIETYDEEGNILSNKVINKELIFIINNISYSVLH